MLTKIFYATLMGALLCACGSADKPATTVSEPAEAPPVVTQSPEYGPWESLFDGQTLNGWHKYGGEEVGSAWKVVDGTLHLDVSDKDGWQTNNGGDIVTDKSFSNYELELDWKIGDCGNSGIIYNVREDDRYEHPWNTGPEMQILDNSCHPDAKITTHRAGDLYDMVSVREENARPAGEWNTAKLVVTDGEVEHWLNGELQITYANTGDDWEKMIAGSKFKDMPDWGTYTQGKISLQDHGDPVWFRNIRIRERSK